MARKEINKTIHVIGKNKRSHQQLAVDSIKKSKISIGQNKLILVRQLTAIIIDYRVNFISNVTYLLSFRRYFSISSQ